VPGYPDIATDPWQALRSVVLPILTLTPVYLSDVARIGRASPLDVMRTNRSSKAGWGGHPNDRLAAPLTGRSETGLAHPDFGHTTR
jgi:hypothetical protein